MRTELYAGRRGTEQQNTVPGSREFLVDMPPDDPFILLCRSRTRNNASLLPNAMLSIQGL